MFIKTVAGEGCSGCYGSFSDANVSLLRCVGCDSFVSVQFMLATTMSFVADFVIETGGGVGSQGDLGSVSGHRGSERWS